MRGPRERGSGNEKMTRGKSFQPTATSSEIYPHLKREKGGCGETRLSPAIGCFLDFHTTRGPLLFVELHAPSLEFPKKK